MKLQACSIHVCARVRMSFAPISERKTHGCTQSVVMQKTLLCDGDPPSDGGFMILEHSTIGTDLRIHFKQFASWYGRKQFSAAGKRAYQSSALVSPQKNVNTDLAPIGDDSGPIEVPQEDVEMENDEDEEEEPLEAEVPRARMNPKNPTS